MRIICTCLLCSLFSVAYGQINVGSNTFPVRGDTLKYFVQNFPPITISTPGPNQEWDYNSLSSAIQLQLVMLDPTESRGSNLFPDSDYYIVSDSPITVFGEGQTGDRFMKLNDGVVEELGFFAETSFGINLIARYDKPGQWRRAPMKYGDKNITEFNFSIPFATAELPDTLMEELPAVPDSFRLLTNVIRNESIDSWGIIHLPSGSFEVLRLFRHDRITSNINILLSPGVWAKVEPSQWSPLEQYFQPQDLFSYVFLNDKSKEEIAVIETNANDKVQRIQYKANAIQTNSFIIQSGERDVIAHPNPTFGQINFELMNYNPGNYKIEIYNVVGKKLWSKDFRISNSSKSLQEDLSFLSKGTYLYSLLNRNGKKIVTKRIMIITP